MTNEPKQIVGGGIALIVSVAAIVLLWSDNNGPTRLERNAFWKESLDYAARLDGEWYVGHNDRCDCNCIYDGISAHRDRRYALCTDCQGRYDSERKADYEAWLDRNDDDGRLRRYGYAQRR